MKKALVALCLSASVASAATILGFGVEADYYTPKASGDFNYKSTSTTFSNNQESAYQFGAYMEHPVPLLPNLRIDYTPESSFTGGTNTVSFNQTDITPYYEILDNIVDIDIGITCKILDGNVKGVVNENFRQAIPMGYLNAAVMFPGLPLSLSGNVKYIGHDGDSFTDARIKAMWNIAAGIQAQAGYRYESMKIDNRFDITADATFKGPFVGFGFTF